MPSFSARRTSRSCAVPRTQRNSLQRAAQLGYSALAITDECSLAGVVRAHVAAKEAKPAVYRRLVLPSGERGRLAGIRAHPVLPEIAKDMATSPSSSRSPARAPKGEYRLTPQDLSRPDKEYRHLLGVPDCLAILVPSFPAKEDVLDAQVEWLDETFRDARGSVSRCISARDGRHSPWRGGVRRAQPRRAGGRTRRSADARALEETLQDTITAIRVGKPVHECGYDLAPNAEQHLRSRLRLANLYSPDAPDRNGRHCRALHVLAGRIALRVSGRTGAARMSRRAPICDRRRYIGAQRRFPSGIPHHVQEQIEHELELIARPEVRAVLSDGLRPGALRAQSSTSCVRVAGPAANSAVCYCLGCHGGGPGTRQHAVRALHFRRSAASRRISTSTSSTSGVKKSSSTSIASTVATRAALAAAVIDVPRAVRCCANRARRWASTCRSSMRSPSRITGSITSADLLKRFEECGLDTATPHHPARGPRSPRNCYGFPRHLSAALRRLRRSAAASSHGSCPSRTPRCPSVASSSGTRTTSNRSDC